MKTIQQSFPELNRALGCEVYLKREDQHKYGSHKGRSIPFLIKKYFKGERKKFEDGTDDIGPTYNEFVISSSGNAALSAIHAVQAHNRNNPEKISLRVFIGLRIDPKKLKMLTAIIEDPKVTLEQVEKPKQTAFQLEKENDSIKFLRQSTDDNALLGYYELADELNRIPNLQAIFIPTSSGTTAQALGEAFETIEPSVWGGEQHPQIHVIQTTACHPIAQDLDTGVEKTDTSIAGAIVDKVAHRKEHVLEVIKKTSGSGWIVTDEEIKQAQDLVKDACKIATSPNAALSVAGLMKALRNDFKYDGVVVCLLTGM
ncbi:PLP-dependent lyase/thiolase [Candidatus Parcubacteria bacterium]|jgi:threonine synthase|nr:PLP-dependent lyase/thiolase [Candidatus Parcubacteria bacterium]MBT3948586.1 PLP-dependent lyase/thiolase [Candidatus Parcubacteria bacterium]